MQLPIQILVYLRQLLWRNEIKYLKNLFSKHTNRFEGVSIQLLKNLVTILSKFTVLCLSSYFVVYFLELKLTVFYYLFIIALEYS